MPSILLPRVSTTEVGTNAHAILVFWLAFQIIGAHIFLPILVGIFTLSKKARRHPTLVNLCCVWIFSGIASCLLLYTNTHEGPEPPFGLCLTQGSLLYGIPPMTATAVGALVFQVWVGVFNTRRDTVNKKWDTFRTAMLVGAPYIVFGAWSTAAAWLGLKNHENVSRNRRFFYCSLDHSPLTNGIGVFSALVLIITMGFEIWIGIILHRNWRAIRSGTGKAGGNLDAPLVLRVVFFGSYCFVGAILSILSVFAPKSPIPDLWVASVGPIVVLIFGSQADVLRTLAFWKKDDENTLVQSQSSQTALNDKA